MNTDKQQTLVITHPYWLAELEEAFELKKKDLCIVSRSTKRGHKTFALGFDRDGRQMPEWWVSEVPYSYFRGTFIPYMVLGISKVRGELDMSGRKLLEIAQKRFPKGLWNIFFVGKDLEEGESTRDSMALILEVMD